MTLSFSLYSLVLPARHNLRLGHQRLPNLRLRLLGMRVCSNNSFVWLLFFATVSCFVNHHRQMEPRPRTSSPLSSGDATSMTQATRRVLSQTPRLMWWQWQHDQFIGMTIGQGTPRMRPSYGKHRTSSPACNAVKPASISSQMASAITPKMPLFSR